MMEIPGHVLELMSSLETAGFESWVVGGCVRDALLGKAPHDWDMCSSAPAGDMLSIFSPRYPIVDAGLKHGTVGVVTGGGVVEITTYRVDGAYSDHRHPDGAVFTGDVKEDLARRDFTINAMAYSPAKGLLDLFGGREDLERGVVRAVGDPMKRFDEDALRIMRALRFASVLGFEIDSATSDAVRRLAPLLKEVSAERIREEFAGLLGGVDAVGILREYSDVVGVFIPEITRCVGFDQKNHHHLYDVWEHTLRVIDGVDRGDTTLRLAALFHDIAKPLCAAPDKKGELHFFAHPVVGAALAGEIMRRLRFDKNTTRRVCRLITYHDHFLKPDRKKLTKLLAVMGEDMPRLVALQRADLLAHAPEVVEIGLPQIEGAVAELEKIKSERTPVTVAELAINGSDVMRITGMKPGRRVGELLERLLEKVISGEVANDAGALEEEIKVLSSEF